MSTAGFPRVRRGLDAPTLDRIVSYALAGAFAALAPATGVAVAGGLGAMAMLGLLFAAAFAGGAVGGWHGWRRG